MKRCAPLLLALLLLAGCSLPPATPPTPPQQRYHASFLTLFDTVAAPIGESCACHYPAACESGGKLYVIATRSGKILRIRGAVLFEIDLAQV